MAGLLLIPGLMLLGAGTLISLTRPAMKKVLIAPPGMRPPTTPVPTGGRPTVPTPAPTNLAQYNVDQVNSFRAKGGLRPLTLDSALSTFATQGSQQLSQDHSPHAHFISSAQGAPGFGTMFAENQGDQNGVFPMDQDPTVNTQKQIDEMLTMMMNEGPGGGHYANIMNNTYSRIGVGLVTINGRLYMTNDFSN